MSSNQVQLGMFNETTLNVARSIKVAMNDDVRESGRSREQIVDRMNELAGHYGVCLTKGNGRQLTIETLEKWLNPSELSRQMPLKALPIFCVATGRISTINLLARSIGLRVIDHHEQNLLKWAEIDIQKRKLTKQSRRLAQEVGL